MLGFLKVLVVESDLENNSEINACAPPPRVGCVLGGGTCDRGRKGGREGRRERERQRETEI